MKNKNQINLYKDRNNIKHLYSSTKLGLNRFIYLKNFFKKNKYLTLKTLLLLKIQILVEIIIFLIATNLSKSNLGGDIYFNNNLLVFIIIFFCIFYTIITFLSIKYERTLVFNLINDLRRIIFKENLKKEEYKNTIENKSNLIAKVSYHLSLLNMGIDNTLLLSLRWFIYIIILFIFSIFNKESYLYITIVVFLVSIILFFISYFISKIYISRQVASYSKMVKDLTTSMLEIFFIKKFHREKIEEKKLDNIVEIDTHFRIKRDIWLRYSNRVLFVLIISFGAIYSLLKNYYPSISIEVTDELIFKSFFYFYIIRILYSSIKAGLYFLPLKLGMFLSIPDRQFPSLNFKNNLGWKIITFNSNKIKLFKESFYYKNISIKFEKGYRYLFFGDSGIGKSSLASLFAGNGYFSRHSWFVKMDKKHFSYNNWSLLFKDSYFFSSHFSTDMTIGEIVLNKEKENINEKDLELIALLSQKYPIFNSIFSKTRFVGESAKRFISSPISLFKIQAVYCILNKPSFIIIDNVWLDLKYEEIEKLINILDKELPRSTIVLFSREKNSTIIYNEIYEIQKNTISKI